MSWSVVVAVGLKVQNILVFCNLVILKNRTKYFSRQTSFCQFSNMASSGLKKIFILTILYTHRSVSVNICLIIFFLIFSFLMADVMPYYRLMLCFG